MTTEQFTETVKKSAGRLGPYIVGFLGIQLFISATNSGLGGLLIPNRLALLDPDNKVALLGWAAGAAAALSLIAAPLWGMLSDRTRGRFGRRMPWILVGIIGVAVFAAALAFANDVIATIALFAIFSVFVAMVSGPISATVPDRTPVEKRGLFSAFAGIGVFVGGIIGNIVASVFSGNIFIGFLTFAVIALVGSLPLIGTMREDTSAHPPVSTFRDTLRTFIVSPRKYPDFFWAFLARLVIVIGFQSVISFQLYILSDYVGLGLEGANGIYPIAVVLATVALVLALVPSGLISDKIGRRKPIVIISAIIVAASTIPPLIAPTVPVAIASLTLAGVGIGGYLAVDQALMTQVLPNNADAGKDLGVLNIAQQGGAVLAPVCASIMITLFGYPGLYIFAGLLSAISALAVLPIKSVR